MHDFLKRTEKEPPLEVAVKKLAKGRERRKKGIKGRPEWVKTGIPGFDDLIEHGGIPQGSNILVSGGPGTGKTIFCLQTLYNAARKGHKCLYITFEESPEKLKKHMRQFGWKIDSVVNNDLLIVRRMDPFRIARSVEALLAKAAGQLPMGMEEMPKVIPEGSDPYMIAMDSVSALESAFTGKPESYRIYIEQLFRLFEKTGAMTFLITETEEVPKRYSRTGVEEFLADGVLVFYYGKVRDIRTRAVEILKLRGAKHVNKIVPLNITEKGLEVFPGERVFEAE